LLFLSRLFNGVVRWDRVVSMIWWLMHVEELVKWKSTGESEMLGENLLSATLSTTDPTWPDLGSNPGRRDGKSATNHLSHVTVPFQLCRTLKEYFVIWVILGTANSFEKGPVWATDNRWDVQYITRLFKNLKVLYPVTYAYLLSRPQPVTSSLHPFTF
jgi:hypothetical protein